MQRFFDFPVALLSFFQQVDQRFRCPRRPDPLDVPLRPTPIPGIRAVLWDIYGTLFGCARGDLAASMRDGQRQQAAAWLLIKEFSLQPPLSQLYPGRPPQIALRDRLMELIDQSHRNSRAAGIEYPEVLIEKLWQTIVDDCSRLGWSPPRDEPASQTACRLAYFFEAALEKTHLYSGAAICLDTLNRAGIVQGIISNAQFYTPLRLRSLLRTQLARETFELDDIFAEPLTFFSFELGFSKPNPIAFDLCLERLAARAIQPHQALYIGNDMLNDIFPAQQHGLKTVLFVGDRQQARLHSEEPLCQNLKPDAVIADLKQLPNLLLRESNTMNGADHVDRP